MLQSIHDKVKGVLGIIIVILIGLTFALWGIGDYLTGANEKYAARVDGVEITQSEFDRGMDNQRKRLEEMFQGKVPDSPALQERMKEQVLESLITQRVLKKAIDEGGYRIANQELAQRIKAMQAFQVDGVFDAVAYQAVVQGQGRGVKEFENLYRNDLAVQQLQSGIMRSSVVGKGELNILHQIQQQSRDINYLQFDDSLFTDELSITDEQIETYFEENKSRFMHPETVSISYVELKASDLAKDIPVDEKAVKNLYDEYVKSLSSKEQRKARHILISLPADADAQIQQKKKGEAEALLVRINDGESFETLAKMESDDPGSAEKGGDLGWVSKGKKASAFETALFKLEKGAVSGVVKSSFGYHIIRLDDIKRAEVVSFESRKADLIAQYQTQKIEDSFYEKSELMATTAYENDQSLQEVADALNLEIKTLAAFSRFQGTGVAENPKVRNAAFDSAVLVEGRNSDVIEPGSNHALVLRVEKHTETKAKALEDVKAQIIAALKASQAREKSQAAALSALVKLEQGKPIDSKEVKMSATLTKVGSVKRDDKKTNQQVLQEAFTMPRPEKGASQYKVVELATGAAVIELVAVTVPEEASDEQLQVLSRQFLNEQATRDMEVVLNYLKSKADIVRQTEL
ncbi:hypothetical protein MNBD_GAMMA11-3232 [hydrothermal vent metagenome]|uniref:Periplasmic chaperone PpiD n=1 Tax=hydrothermal vent metagenome TaxID=652676 RepID=A0A3B0WSK9_9ZZZZ